MTKANKFNFFNKQDGVIEDLNVAFTQDREYLMNLLTAYLSPGFIPPSTGLTLFNATTGEFTFSQGTTIDDLTMSVSGSNIYGITPNATSIFIVDADVAWSKTPGDYASSGNVNIDLSNGGAYATAQPYDRWIWIKYKELQSNITADTRVDYDGGLNYPVRNIGYEIIIEDQDPSVAPVADALYILKVSVASSTQTYDTTASSSPAYAGQLTSKFRDDTVWTVIDSGSYKPTTYADPSTSSVNLSLRDHINAIGSGTVAPDNPHGITPDDMPQSDTANIATDAITTNELAPDAVETTNIKDANVTTAKLAVTTQLDLMPTGSVIMWAGNPAAVPTSWEICDGREFATASYVPLEALLGTYWGTATAGNFRIPDLRGMFVRGADTASTVNPQGSDPDKNNRLTRDGAAAVATSPGSYQQDETAAHTHSYTAAGASQDMSPQSGSNFSMAINRSSQTTGSDGGATETRALNAYIHYIIKMS